jgi:hypothetical protein
LFAPGSCGDVRWISFFIASAQHLRSGIQGSGKGLRRRRGPNATEPQFAIRAIVEAETPGYVDFVVRLTWGEFDNCVKLRNPHPCKSAADAGQLMTRSLLRFSP